MWYYRSKIGSIHGLSKGITHSRSMTTAKYIYTPKAYYSDHTCPKEKDIDLSLVRRISEYFIKPKHKTEESNQIYHLTTHDLALLCFQYIHFGLMFPKPSHINNQDFSIYSFLESLKKSLSLTLVHFYPLAGQLATKVDEDKHESVVYVDCNKGPGARFIHATLDMTIYDILSPKDVPLVVNSFFDLNDEKLLNYDGHSKPLLSVQVTELLDGIFISCTVNHCLTDGTSYWHFWNVWSEIHRGNENHIVSESNLPVLTRWQPNGHAPSPYPIPYIHPDEFVRRKKVEPPQLSDRIIHFSSESMARLKAKANEENGYTKNISSFQSLWALFWRSTVRANRLPHNQITINNMTINCRKRIDPPLPNSYFGNFFQIISTSTTTGELLENNLGWAALLLHQSVANFDDKNVRNFVNEWIRSPNINSCADASSQNKTAGAANSPKFDMYGNDFGLGKVIAFRSGHGNKTNGLVYACPGNEGGQSVELEICLSPDSMDSLELDQEFMSFVSDNGLRS